MTSFLQLEDFKNCIDNVIVNFKEGFGVSETGLSPDHKAADILIDVKKSDEIRRYIQYSCFTQNGMFPFYQLIDAIDWSFISDSSLNVGDKFNKFTVLIQSRINWAFPLKSKLVSSNTKKIALFQTIN